ncbi:MAG: 2-dehydro-3-deoxyglucarate aldolase [Planctomycetes bacterium]|nr:2-dehydro-3-deoxyglucarate aldolase [Planctomycetota bacterium]
MKTNTVKQALKRGEAQIGTWLTLASPFAARVLARSGFHWFTVDVEHSPVNWETAALMFAMIADAGGVPLARVPSNTHENIKRALDSGAYGIVVPMVNTPEEAEAAVAAAKYPLAGRRSVGGTLHALAFGAAPADYYARANDEILVVLQAEHVKAVENAEKIYSLPGIDAMFIGPNDLLSSMGKPPKMESPDKEFVDALRHLRETAARHGVAPGLHTGDPAMAARRLKEGWRFIAVGSDMSMLVAGAKAAVADLKLGEAREAARY